MDIFYLFTIVNNAARNMQARVLSEFLLSTFWGRYLEKVMW